MGPVADSLPPWGGAGTSLSWRRGAQSGGGASRRARCFEQIAKAGTLVVVMQKPEGLPYAGFLAAAFWLGRDTVMLRASVIAGAAAGGLALALQHDLHSFGHPTQIGTTCLAVFAAAGVALGLDLALRQCGTSWRWRAGSLLVAAPLAVVSLALANGGDGSSAPISRTWTTSATGSTGCRACCSS